MILEHDEYEVVGRCRLPESRLPATGRRTATSPSRCSRRALGAGGACARVSVTRGRRRVRYYKRRVIAREGASRTSTSTAKAEEHHAHPPRTLLLRAVSCGLLAVGAFLVRVLSQVWRMCSGSRGRVLVTISTKRRRGVGAGNIIRCGPHGNSRRGAGRRLTRNNAHRRSGCRPQSWELGGAEANASILHIVQNLR